MRIPINETAWQDAGIPTIVYPDRVSIRLLDDYARHQWHDLPRVVDAEGDNVVLMTDRSALHRQVAQKLGRL